MQKHLGLLIVCLLSACGPAMSTKTVDPQNVLRSFREDILTSDHVSPATLQAIHMAGFEEKAVLRDGDTLTDDPNFQKFTPNALKSYVASELAIGHALQLERAKKLDEAFAFYVHAAKLALNGIFEQECKLPLNMYCDGFKIYYGRALIGVLSYLKAKNWSAQTVQVAGKNPSLSYAIEVSTDSEYENPAQYEFLQPSAAIGLEGLANRHRRPGIGIGLTACRKKRDDSNFDKYLPKAGLCLPLTALLKFPDDCAAGVCKAQLEFINDLTTDEVEIEGQKLPLAADVSAPFAKLIERSGIGGMDGMLGAFSSDDRLLKATGFYAAEPYDPNKIPVITVHGLFSSPVTWLSLHNDMLGDPVIRKHYQFWHYLYSTNLPILLNAATFRKKLAELDEFLASHGGDAKTHQMVVISHSMGGLLTKTAVVDTGEPVRKVLFGSGERLKTLDAAAQAELADLLDFKPNPTIERVIFVSVPHRGSLMSESIVGQLGRMLISLPKVVLNDARTLGAKLKSALDPKVESAIDLDDLSSVRGLSPNNPVLKALSEIAVDQRIPFHSIMGDQGLGGGKESSDGVVAYSSSHLEGAQSELIVPADHSAHVHPRAVSEIKRILHLDLEERTKRELAVEEAKAKPKKKK